VRRVRALAIACALSLVAASALAHPLDPGLLELAEQGASGRFAVRFVAPRAAPALAPIWPAACRVEPDAAVLDCGAARLAGASIGIAELERSGASVLARVRFGDGRVLSAWLDARTPVFAVPMRASRAALFLDHVRLGVAHLFGGLDHLLFLAGLVALLRRGRPLLLAVTAFTAGHSVTLACAVLGLLHVPPGVIEPAIAATLVGLAWELARRAEGRGAATQRPLVLPFSFGLLHGLGFASALDWLGVPRADVPIALAGFNGGIEVAQLALVVALRCAAALLAPLARPLPPALSARSAALAPVYTIGTLGVYWLLTRLAAVATGL